MSGPCLVNTQRNADRMTDRQLVDWRDGVAKLAAKYGRGYWRRLLHQLNQLLAERKEPKVHESVPTQDQAEA